MEPDPVNPAKCDRPLPADDSKPFPFQNSTAEAQLNAVVENMAEAFFALDSTGRCTYLNGTAERLFQVDRTHWLSIPLWEVFQAGPSSQLYQQCPVALAQQRSVGFEDFYPCLNRWFAVRLLPAAGGLAAYFEDITERKQTEMALRQEQEFLRVLLDHVQAGIVACDGQGRLKLFNRAARMFHGVDERPLPPEQWADYYDLYRPDGKTLMALEEIPLFRALQGQPVQGMEMMISPRGGTPRVFLASGQAIVDAEGKKQGAVVVMHDITDRKQAEAERMRFVQEQTARTLAEAAQFRSAFLAEASELLASSLDYGKTLGRVAQLAVPYLADWCAVDLLEEDGTIHRVAVAHIDPEKVQLGWDLASRFAPHLEDGYGIGQVIKTGKREIAVEITDEQIRATVPDPNYQNLLLSLGLKSSIVAPLRAHGRVLGAVSFVYAESNRRYTPEDLKLAEDLARRAALAIDNARLYFTAQQAQQAAETAANRKGRLQAVAAALSETLTPVQVVDVVVEQSMAAVEADGAMMALLNESGTGLDIIRVIGYESPPEYLQEPIPLDGSTPLAHAVRTGEPVWLEPLQDRIARYPHLAETYSQLPFKAWISLPLVVEKKVLGGLSLSFTQFKQLSQDDREFILALSRQCAQAIFRAQLYEAERQARTAAEQANRVKDEFLAVLSHELRSPLNPILGWTRILRTRSLPPDKTERALAIVERNAKLQAQLVEDLLDISRMLRGKLSLNVVPVDLATVIQGSLETVQLSASAKAIQLHPQLHAINRTIMGDPNRLQQVVWNLLSNAIKFTPEGGRVEVRLEEVREWASGRVGDGKGVSGTGSLLGVSGAGFQGLGVSGTGSQISGPQDPLSPDVRHPTPETRHLMSAHPSTLHIQITVTDSGKGIEPQFLPHIFDYFRQADSSITRQFGGLGLGLAIARQSVELHGGTIWADSPGDGLGATFTIRLPLAPALHPVPAPPDPAVPAAPSLTGLHILVVDDEADMRELAEFVLNQQGGQVTVAASAAEAIAILDRLQPDILVCDIGMPDMDGYTLVRHLRANSLAVPALALTAYAAEYDRTQAMAAGFQRHIAKPVEPRELVRAIVEVVKPT